MNLDFYKKQTWRKKQHRDLILESKKNTKKMVEELSVMGAVQLIKPTKYESEDGQTNTKFELQTEVLERLLEDKGLVD